MEKEFASTHAFALIKAGLESGSIKLLGPNNVNPQEAGQKDAQYLLTLYTGLQKELTDQAG